jgi:hypothetical protein
MKTIIAGLLIAISPSSVYSAIPAEPKPQEGKLAVQVVKVEHPKKFDLPLGHGLNPAAMFQDGSNTLTQYPTLYAEVGTAVTNDQTRSVVMAEDFNIVDGKAILKEKTYKLGLSIAATIAQIENDVADLKLNFSIQKLKGFDEFTIEEGTKVKLPMFESVNMNTDVSLQLGSWVVLGGLAGESDTTEEKTTLYFVRVKDPRTNEQSPVQLTLDDLKKYQFQVK